MKFEDLKLPTDRELRETFKAHNTLTCVAGWIASLVFDQMREHYEADKKQPAPVEYVPLGPEDVPPGSAVRAIGEKTWRLVTRVEEDCFGTSAGTFDWCDLAERCEILRPGSKTWEPCKKPKA